MGSMGRISPWSPGSAPERMLPSLLRTRRIEPVVRSHASRPHHVENSRGEAEQQKYDHPPRRDSKPAVEHPADASADQDARNELGRQPKPAGDRRRIGGRACSRLAVGGTVVLFNATATTE